MAKRVPCCGPSIHHDFGQVNSRSYAMALKCPHCGPSIGRDPVDQLPVATAWQLDVHVVRTGSYKIKKLIYCPLLLGLGLIKTSIEIILIPQDHTLRA